MLRFQALQGNRLNVGAISHLFRCDRRHHVGGSRQYAQSSANSSSDVTRWLTTNQVLRRRARKVSHTLEIHDPHWRFRRALVITIAIEDLV